MTEGLGWLPSGFDLQDTVRHYKCLSPTKICKINTSGNNCNAQNWVKRYLDN